MSAVTMIGYGHRIPWDLHCLAADDFRLAQGLRLARETQGTSMNIAYALSGLLALALLVYLLVALVRAEDL